MTDTCVAEGCDRPPRIIGLCWGHYRMGLQGVGPRVDGNQPVLELDGPTPCRDNPRPFDDETRYDEAKAMCMACTHLWACRDFALRTGQPYQVWGGMTPGERYQALRRARARAGVARLPRDAEQRRRFGGWADHHPDAILVGRHAAPGGVQ